MTIEEFLDAVAAQFPFPRWELTRYGGIRLRMGRSGILTCPLCALASWVAVRYFPAQAIAAAAEELDLSLADALAIVHAADNDGGQDPAIERLVLKKLGIFV